MSMGRKSWRLPLRLVRTHLPLALTQKTVTLLPVHKIVCGTRYRQREVQSVWTRQIPFRVDIAGVIEIMGSSLYSRLDTPIRELIQNVE